MEPLIGGRRKYRPGDRPDALDVRRSWLRVDRSFQWVEHPVLSCIGHMIHDLQQTIALLSRTPAALDALLRDLPEVWTLRNEGADTWSPVEIVGHLIHAERTDWMPRTRLILQSAQTPTFETFDRLGHAEESAGASLEQQLDLFAQLRATNLDELRGFSVGREDLERKGMHPALGEVSLSQLLATWVAHDLSHLHQLSRVMAHQYRDLIGPWTAYLGVMQCAGHSA